MNWHREIFIFNDCFNSIKDRTKGLVNKFCVICVCVCVCKILIQALAKKR